MNLDIGPFNDPRTGYWYADNNLDFAIFCSIEKYKEECIYVYIDRDISTPDGVAFFYSCHSIKWSNQSTLERLQLNISFNTADPDIIQADGKVYIFKAVDLTLIWQTTYYITKSSKGIFLMPCFAGGNHFIGLCIEYDRDKGSKVSFFDPFGDGGYREFKEGIKNALRKTLGNNIKFKESTIKVQNDAHNCGPWTFLFIEKAIEEIVQNRKSVYDNLDSIVTSISKTNLMSIRRKHNALIVGLTSFHYSTGYLYQILSACTSDENPDVKFDTKLDNVTVTIDGKPIFDKGERVGFCERNFTDKKERFQDPEQKTFEADQAGVWFKSHNTMSSSIWTRFFPKSTTTNTPQSSVMHESLNTPVQKANKNSIPTAPCILLLLLLGCTLKKLSMLSKNTNIQKLHYKNAKILILSAVIICACLFFYTQNSADKERM